MSNNKHLSFNDRLTIERNLFLSKSLKYIGKILDTDCTTIFKKIKNQGQSIHQVLINNKNKIMFSDKTIYKLIDLGLLEVRNIDLSRKVRFRTRNFYTLIHQN